METIIRIKEQYDLAGFEYEHYLEYNLSWSKRLEKHYIYKKISPANYRRVTMFCEVARHVLKAINIEIPNDLTHQVLKGEIEGIKEPHLKIQLLRNKIITFIEIAHQQGKIVNTNPVILNITAINEYN